MVNYKVAEASAIVANAGKTDEMKLKGLQSIALPLGFSVSTITVGEMGQRIDDVVPVSGAYEELSVNYNFVMGDKSQLYLQKASYNNTKITDMRFMVDDDVLAGDFVALDLISDPDGYYSVGNFSNPSGGRNEVIAGSISILPAGSSVIFSSHASGTDLSFTAYDSVTPALANVTDTSGTLGFVTNLGFEVGMTVIIDRLNGLDPLYAKIETVSDTVIEFANGVGDEPSIPTAVGDATTAIHGATPVI